GQVASFEWVFSPRGPDGRPVPMFDRQTGALRRDVLRYWQRYDIRRRLAEDWESLGPRLRGKLHIITGAADTFHLEEATALLCEFLREKCSAATCELVPGRTHIDLYAPDPQRYPKGLGARIAAEMGAVFDAGNLAQRPPMR